MNLFSDEVSRGYTTIYSTLGELRELFHRTGRLDDSNAKLDEVAKIIATYMAYKRGLISTFPFVENEKLSNKSFVKELQNAFKTAINLDCYRDWNSNSVFGLNPSLALREDDGELARSLVKLVQQGVDIAFLNKKLGNPFDLLNEAFGHFVRDNFRGNIEDAQYMTPPEVVDLMVDIAISDISKEDKNDENEFILVDPTCGVSSFLTCFYHKAIDSNILKKGQITLIGQDKVDRMVRLSVINMALCDSAKHEINSGNSLARDSKLTKLNGKVDLILTNPPFGARFSASDISDAGLDNLPFFYSIKSKIGNVDSELLFIDRNLSLLREGGRLLIVVPDSVISSRGTPALLRHRLKDVAELRAIIELPPVTFAQAGTRTKTCIVYLVKRRSDTQKYHNVFLATSKDLGFEVASRKGVQVKVACGDNDLPKIFHAYEESFKLKKIKSSHIVNDKPSCVVVPTENVINNGWTPSHYSAKRLRAISILRKNKEIQLLPLRELASFESEKRSNKNYTSNYLFISVLHIIGEGIVDISGIRTYKPTTPGIPVKPGELILSRINPRIPRAMVVPKFEKSVLCSSEFEVLAPIREIDPYLLMYLIYSNQVQAQIQSLTSGTSASHNRIKTQDLENVLIPIPVAGSTSEKSITDIIEKYKHYVTRLFDCSSALVSIRMRETTYKKMYAS